MTQPFITFESLENGLVARYMKCVEKERPALGLPASFDTDIMNSVERMLPKFIAVARREGLIAPDEREEFEKEAPVSAEIHAQFEDLKTPAPRVEKFWALEPTSKFVADGDYEDLVATVALARMEHEKALRESAAPDPRAIYGLASLCSFGDRIA